MGLTQTVIAIPAICVIDSFSFDNKFADWDQDSHIFENVCEIILDQSNNWEIHNFMEKLWIAKGGKDKLPGEFIEKHIRIVGADIVHLSAQLNDWQNNDSLYRHHKDNKQFIDIANQAIKSGRALYYYSHY